LTCRLVHGCIHPPSRLALIFTLRVKKSRELSRQLRSHIGHFTWRDRLEQDRDDRPRVIERLWQVNPRSLADALKELLYREALAFTR